ncbi:MAG: hypothetical protein HXX80_04470 [Nitrososphaerales archaeon]|nr:hypothetical protein [Nitrososphaerales archaeon]
MGGKIRSELGKHVAIIVNDRTEIAVDGRTVKDLGFEVSEIAGGCVCINVQDFTDSISSIIEKLNPDVIFLEPIGIGLPSRVWATIRKNVAGRVDLAPIVVLLDTRKIHELYKKHGGLGLTLLGHLLSQQIKDAEILVMNKVDLVPSNELATISGYIRKIKPDSEILMTSAETGLGFDELSRIVLNGSSKILAPPTQETLMKHAEVVSEMSWVTEQYEVKFENQSDILEVERFVQEFLKEIRKEIVARRGETVHIKLHFKTDNGSLKASLVDLSQGVKITSRISGSVRGGTLTVNFIVRKLKGEELKSCVTGVLSRIIQSCIS